MYPPHADRPPPACPATALAPRTTDSDPTHCLTLNRLLGQAAPTAPNQTWVGDIIYLPNRAAAGSIWLRGLTAIHAKSWAWCRRDGTAELRESMPEDLVSEALRRARPAAGLFIHSDQGSQYTATRFRKLVARYQALPSKSRRGNCYDNDHY